MLNRLARPGDPGPRRVLGVAGLLLAAAAVLGVRRPTCPAAGSPSRTRSRSGRPPARAAFDAGDTNLVLTGRAPGGATPPRPAAPGRAGADLRRSPVRQRGARRTGRRRRAGRRAAQPRRGRRAGRRTHRRHRRHRARPRRRHRRAARRPPRGSARSPPAGRPSPSTRSTRRPSPTWPSPRRSRSRSPSIVLVLVFGSLFAALLRVAVGISAIVGAIAMLPAVPRRRRVGLRAGHDHGAGPRAGDRLRPAHRRPLRRRGTRQRRPGRRHRPRCRPPGGRCYLRADRRLSLAAMLVFPLFFLGSTAYAAWPSSCSRSSAALMLLPAVLTLLGPRVDRLDCAGRLRGPRPPGAGGAGRWRHVLVPRRPAS